MRTSHLDSLFLLVNDGYDCANDSSTRDDGEFSSSYKENVLSASGRNVTANYQDDEKPSLEVIVHPSSTLKAGLAP